MNGIKGISLNTPGFPLDEPVQEEPRWNLYEQETRHPLIKGTFKMRKTNAMRKKGLNFKGNPLGTSLNSLAIRVKVRKAQEKMNGMDPEIAKALFKATTKAQASNRGAMKKNGYGTKKAYFNSLRNI
jgi:hypothetical protein